MTPEPIISIENLWFSYNRALVLEDVNLAINEREFVWIVGPNGGGKTTLLKLMLGLLKPARGSVHVFGESPQQARRRLGYLPQQVHLDPLFPVNVTDVVLMGRLGNGHTIGPYRQVDRQAADRALQEVGLWEVRKQTVAALSGGQLRRLLIARALAGEPELLLLDEPTANLDLAVAEELYELLRVLNQHLTIVMVSHDPAFVSQFVKRVVCVKRKISVHPTCDMDEKIMDELYGRRVRMVRHDQQNV
jgi:zinc transport system ATP-binding protein